MIEIRCLQYSDLVIQVDPKNLEDTEIQRIRAEALRISGTCNRRCFGGDCPGVCPIPRVGVADLTQIREAILSLK